MKNLRANEAGQVIMSTTAPCEGNWTWVVLTAGGNPGFAADKLSWKELLEARELWENRRRPETTKGAKWIDGDSIRFSGMLIRGNGVAFGSESVTLSEGGFNAIIQCVLAIRELEATRNAEPNE